MLSTSKPTKTEHFRQIMLEQTGKTASDLEREGELSNLYVLSLNDKDVVQSYVGKKDSRSLGIQIRKFKEHLPSDDRNELFLFVSLDELAKCFADYLYGKYPGKRAREWEAKFNDPRYMWDVKRLLASRIYEHKHELTQLGYPAFVSPEAQNAVSLLFAQKHIRKSSHEAVGRFAKVAKENPELAQLPKWVLDTFTAIVSQVFLGDSEKLEITMLRQPANNALGLPYFDPYR